MQMILVALHSHNVPGVHFTNIKDQLFDRVCDRTNHQFFAIFHHKNDVHIQEIFVVTAMLIRISVFQKILTRKCILPTEIQSYMCYYYTDERSGWQWLKS